MAIDLHCDTTLYARLGCEMDRCSWPDLVAPANSSGPHQFDERAIDFDSSSTSRRTTPRGFWADGGLIMRTSSEDATSKSRHGWPGRGTGRSAFLLDCEWMLSPDIRIGRDGPWEPGSCARVDLTYGFDKSRA